MMRKMSLSKIYRLLESWFLRETRCSQNCWRVAANGCGVSWNAAWVVSVADRRQADFCPCRESREIRIARSLESLAELFIGGSFSVCRL